MRRLLPAFRAGAAAGLLLATGAAFANAPSPALASLQSAYAAAAEPGPQADLYRDLFATVLERVQRSYATEADVDALAAAATQVVQARAPGSAPPRELFVEAINTALRGLDPYTRYLDPHAHGEARDAARGSFGGVGIEVAPAEGVVRVVASLPGTPAARAGLQSGDLIVRIDDQPLQGMPLDFAISRMRGEPGTAVAVTVRRSGMPEDFTLSLTRDTIRRQAVRWAMEGEVLVLHLSTFTGPVSGALQQAIVEATAAHAPRAVVLDLRGNPGGLLREAVRTADLFLNQGDIVTVRSRAPGQQRTWKADATEVLAGLPMAVLIDRRSASASELVAAALQDNARATVLGQRSFGKGTVQTTFALGDEAMGALKMTSSYYHRPAGPTVQKTGVAPDIELAAPAPQEAGHAEAAAAAAARVDPAGCTAVYKAADPMLACAVGYLQAGDLAGFMARLPR